MGREWVVHWKGGNKSGDKWTPCGWNIEWYEINDPRFRCTNDPDKVTCRHSACVRAAEKARRDNGGKAEGE